MCCTRRSLTNQNGLGGGSTTDSPLRQGLDRVQQFQQQARQRGDDDLGDDLDPVVSLLEAAIKAEDAGKQERRADKLREAKETVRRLATTYGHVNELAAMLDRLAWPVSNKHGRWCASQRCD